MPLLFLFKISERVYSIFIPDISMCVFRFHSRYQNMFILFLLPIFLSILDIFPITEHVFSFYSRNQNEPLYFYSRYKNMSILFVFPISECVHLVLFPISECVYFVFIPDVRMYLFCFIPDISRICLFIFIPNIGMCLYLYSR